MARPTPSRELTVDVEPLSLGFAVGMNGQLRIMYAHDTATRETIAVHGGRVIKSTGDGILAIFDAPSRALRCAVSINARLFELGIRVRAGVHAGPIVMRDDGDISGVAVNIAARVLGIAAPGEVLASRSVVDLLSADDVRFEDRGEHSLKGVPGTHQLFATMIG